MKKSDSIKDGKCDRVTSEHCDVSIDHDLGSYGGLKPPCSLGDFKFPSKGDRDIPIHRDVIIRAPNVVWFDED